MATAARTVAVLGGGVGGIVAANRLRKLLPQTDRIMLIEREARHVFQPSLLWLAVGTRTPQAIQRPLARLDRKRIEVMTGEITRIDPGARTVTTSRGVVSVDAMIISLGAALAAEIIPGLSEGGYNLYTLEGATAARDALRGIAGGRVVVLTAAPAYKCPAAPYEAAMMIQGMLRKRGLRDQTRVDLYAAEPGPMGVAGPAVSSAVRQLVESKGIRYHPNHQVTSVQPTSRRIDFANGASAEYDVLLYVPPHRAPAAISESGLTSDSGWVTVDRGTFQTAWTMVFAIGDVTSVPLSMGKPLPKAGVFAHAQAEVVAHNLAVTWSGRGTPRRFDGHGKCFVETGDGRAGLGAGNFYGEPTPTVTLHRPSRWWHWSKVLFEQYWLRGSL